MSGFISAVGKIKAGKAAKKQAYAEAQQLEQKAGFTRALSQQEAIEDERQAQLLQSRALAVAAASGGGVSDPTVINVIADLEARGLQNSLNAMATGETEAGYLEASAGMRRSEGRAAKTAGIISGVSSIVKTGESMVGKYG